MMAPNDDKKATGNSGEHPTHEGRNRRTNEDEVLELHREANQNKTDPGHPEPGVTSDSRPRNSTHKEPGDNDTLTKIILMDGKHIWLKINDSTDDEQIKHIISQRQGLNSNSYQLTRSQPKREKEQGTQQTQEETTIRMICRLVGGGRKPGTTVKAPQKNSQKQRKTSTATSSASITAPPGLTPPAGHGATYAAADTMEAPFGEYPDSEPEPDWQPTDWDKDTWEKWLEDKIQEILNHTQQTREDFESHTQQFHSEDNPMGSMEAFTKVMRRLGFNLEAKQHSEQIGVPWEDGPIPNRAMISARFQLAKNTIQLAMTCTKDPKLTSTLNETMKILAKTYDTLVHNVDKVRQRRIREEQK